MSPLAPGAGRLLVHIFIKATALNHKVADDAVEDRAIVVPAVSIADKVRHAVGCALAVQAQADDAQAGFHYRNGFFNISGFAG